MFEWKSWGNGDQSAFHLVMIMLDWRRTHDFQKILDAAGRKEFSQAFDILREAAVKAASRLNINENFRFDFSIQPFLFSFWSHDPKELESWASSTIKNEMAAALNDLIKILPITLRLDGAIRRGRAVESEKLGMLFFGQSECRDLCIDACHSKQTRAEWNDPLLLSLSSEFPTLTQIPYMNPSSKQTESRSRIII